MRYLITEKGVPIYTDVFYHENYEKGTHVYDFFKMRYTLNGKKWEEITYDAY